MILKIASINVDGIGERARRLKFFNLFKNTNCDLLLVQETHIVTDKVLEATTDWGERLGSKWNPAPTPKSGGTAILINPKNKALSLVGYKNSNDGRILCGLYKKDNNWIQIMNVYAPNDPSEREVFFQRLDNFAFKGYDMILAGDFNCVEDPAVDRYPAKTDRVYSRGCDELQEFLGKHALFDKWRETNKTAREYSWHSRKVGENTKSRLDRFYIRSNIKLNELSHEQCVHTDHSFVIADIRIDDCVSERGPGYYKMNTTVLEDEEYYELICKAYEEDKNKEDIAAWWDRQKKRIIEETKAYSRRKRRKLSAKIEQIRKKALQEKDNDARFLLEEELQVLVDEINKGILIRSREKDILNEDRPTAYFYRLEDERQSEGIIREIHDVDDEGKVVKEYKSHGQVMRKLYEYHKEFYSSKGVNAEDLRHYIDGINVTLTDAQRRILNGIISIKEIWIAIKSLKRNRSPGKDGIPIEFYATFFELLKLDLQRLYNRLLHDKCDFPKSQTMGLIKLLHKRNEKERLINWRGITLLCVDYKILTKILTNRLKLVFPKIVSAEQTCAMAGRHIQENTYILRDAIEYANLYDKPTYIVSYDMKNAFDSVEYEYAKAVFDKYNFGAFFTNLFMKMYRSKRLQVMNNGYLSMPFSRGRGMDQGCPMSLPVFCFLQEPLSIAINNNQGIDGFKVPGVERPIKHIQYADDNNGINHKTHNVINTIDEYRRFGRASGVNLNHNKIKGMSIGTDVLPTCPYFDIEWNSIAGLIVLGIIYMTDRERAVEVNWERVYNKIVKGIKRLKYRNLSLQGKVTMINSKILSKAVYLSYTYAITDEYFAKIEDLVRAYIWGGENKRRLIQLRYLYLPKDRGGLGLMHLKTQGQALRLKYVHDILDPTVEKCWLGFARYWLREYFIIKHSIDVLFDENVEQYFYWDDSEFDTIAEDYKIMMKDFETNPVGIMEDKEKTTSSIYSVLRKPVIENTLILETNGWQNFITQKLNLQIRINWKKVWRHTYNSYNIGTVRDVLFKLLHNRLLVRAITKGRRADRTKTCPICLRADETAIHALVQCPEYARKVWDKYSTVYTKLLPSIIHYHEVAALTVNIQNKKAKSDTAKLVRTLTEQLLYEIWISRCKHTGKEQKKVNVERSISSIRFKFLKILRVHYRHYAKSASFNIFEEKFCVNKAICSLDYHNKLNLHLPP